MRQSLQVFITVNLLVACVGIGFAQSSASQIATRRSVRSSQPGPTFVVREIDLQKPTTVIAYGDMRFTDPGNVKATNTSARRALVARIAQEKPDAVLLNGDLTMRGGDQADYDIYQTETQAWRDAHLRVFPALGNHEFANCEIQQCLQNWWRTFPELKDRRWYSAQLGTKLYVIALDSNDSLLPGSQQHRWLEAQTASLPKNIEFVFITMHHEPVADIQLGADDNPRPNEMAVVDLLNKEKLKSKAKFIVVAGHIHNYERFEQNGVVYLVSGGGGAPPGLAAGGAAGSVLLASGMSRGAPHCSTPYSGSSLGWNKLGAMNWSACATIWSSARISQCRFDPYGHWMDTSIPACFGSARTVLTSNVLPGSSVGCSLLTLVSSILYATTAPRDVPSARAR